MASFNNLKDLEAYLQRNMHQVLRDSMELERELASVMSQTIIERVYNSYEPQEYNRRGHLADERNMIISDVFIEPNGMLRVLFENIAEGHDTLQNGMLVDAFESGGEKHWQKQGVWSRDRFFINETVEKIKQNPSNVINAIKKNLREYGFKVK